MINLRKYGVLLTTAKALRFVVYAQDGLKYAAPTFVAGDVTISKNGGAYVNTTNLPVAVGSSWYLTLTAAELTASSIHILISDVTATQIWLDTELNVETHGNASAMYAFDLDIVMRGTDGANTTAPNTVVPDNAAIAANGVAIAALNDFDSLNDVVSTVTTLTNKTGFSLAATGLDTIISTSTGMVEIAKAIWDRVLTDATHNINNSAGKRLRQIAGTDLISSGTAQAGTATTITLDAGENANNNFYDHTMIVIDSGTGVGQSRTIESYNGTTKVATLSDAWAITPDNTSNWIILPNSVAHVGFVTPSGLNNITNDIDTNSTKLATLVGNTQVPKTNVAFNDLQILMVDSVDNVTPKTGLTLTVTRSINSGAFVAVTGTAAEISNGMYQFDASAADMNGAVITFKFSGAGADDTFVTVYTKP